MLLMRSSGGVSIVEGRFKEAGGAARFAAGGPIATLVFTVALISAGLLLPDGPLRVGLMVPAVINGAMLGVNLVPVAPPTAMHSSAPQSGRRSETGQRLTAGRSPGVAS